MKLKNLFSAVAVAIMLTACGTSKKVETPKGETLVVTPCSGTKFMSDSKTFRASAMGTSHSKETAEQKAMTAARAKLAASIETTIKTVTDSYVSSYEVNQQEEVRSKYQSLTREVVNQKVNAVRVICNETTIDKEKMYKVYVAIEMNSEDVVKEINNKISDDEKLRTDYEYEKFKADFAAEMEKMAE